MPKKRRKAKNKRQKQESAENKKFVYALIALFVLLIIGFAVLRLSG